MTAMTANALSCSFSRFFDRDCSRDSGLSDRVGADPAEIPGNFSHFSRRDRVFLGPESAARDRFLSSACVFAGSWGRPE
jgi:hypothetical protein